MKPGKLVSVVGARPQFVKAAMFSRRLASLPERPFEEVLIHTGQHYDPQLSGIFFRELSLPSPAYSLEVGSDPAPIQTGAIMTRLAPILEAEAPDALLVYGDTNSTIAAALTASQMNIPVIHVEAGERVFRRYCVPEEVNRVLADHAASLCLTASRQAEAYLLREGMARVRVRFTGDLMYDLFCWGARQQALRIVTHQTFRLDSGGYILATIHRAENTDSVERLLGILRAFEQAPLPVLLPLHPRTQNKLAEAGYTPSDNLILTAPVGYFDLLGLLEHCRRCVSDSGGVIREAFFSRKPCLVPLANSWWTEITAAGWSREVGDDLAALSAGMASYDPPAEYPEGLFGDGDAAGKIIQAVAERMRQTPAEAPWSFHGPVERIKDPPGSRATFSYARYRGMLGELATAGYEFAAFGEAERLLAEKRRFALLRHDVDLDFDEAWRIARLEADLGIRSTFFFLVRTPFYHVLDREGADSVRKILALGHHLGLHLDLANYGPDEPAAEACRRERELLSGWFGHPVEIISFHRPDERVLAGDPSLTAPVPHTYMPLYREPIHYLSDSQGLWRHGYPTESLAFKNGQPLHILVHPIWYGDVPRNRIELLDRLIDRSAARLRRHLALNCRVYQMDDSTKDWGKDPGEDHGEAEE